MSPIRIAYLVLTVTGAVVPMYFFISWFEVNGYDLMAMVEAWNVSDATTGLTYDLTIVALTLVVWIIYETVGSRRWLNLIAIPASFCIGVSCGLPLYLFLRSRP